MRTPLTDHGIFIVAMAVLTLQIIVVAGIFRRARTAKAKRDSLAERHIEIERQGRPGADRWCTRPTLAGEEGRGLSAPSGNSAT